MSLNALCTCSTQKKKFTSTERNMYDMLKIHFLHERIVKHIANFALHVNYEYL